MVGTQQQPLFVPAVRIQFTGKERDAETGLDYFGARYVSGAQGRFTSLTLSCFLSGRGIRAYLWLRRSHGWLW